MYTDTHHIHACTHPNHVPTCTQTHHDTPRTNIFGNVWHNSLLTKTTFYNYGYCYRWTRKCKGYNKLFCNHFIYTHVDRYTPCTHMYTLTPRTNVYTDTPWYTTYKYFLAMTNTKSVFTKTTFKKYSYCYS
jgi:hypothetical protein